MLLSLFTTFFKIGLFTFGGGYAMIANIREAVIEKKGWLTDDELVEIIAIAESTPGPIAINLATFVGYKKGGFRGSLLATCGVVLPSLAIIYVISLFLDEFMKNTYITNAFVGIKCAVAFLILKAGFNMLGKIPKTVLSLSSFIVALAFMLIFEIFAVNFSSIFFILIGGVAGILFYCVLPYFNRRKRQ